MLKITSIKRPGKRKYCMAIQDGHMNRLTAVVPFSPRQGFERTVQMLTQSPLIEKVIVIHCGAIPPSRQKCEFLEADSFMSGETLNILIEKAGSEYLMFLADPRRIHISDRSLERFLDAAESTGAGMIYSDYLEKKGGEFVEHPLNDYQLGSIRDGFDFGCITVFSRHAINGALKKFGAIPTVEHAGFYDLRLKVSIDHHLFHIQEFLYLSDNPEDGAEEEGQAGERLFDYVDPRNQAAQKEMEDVATQHLKNIGAFLKPDFVRAPHSPYSFPVEASVIIPVRNREMTVNNAVQSALSQNTNFSFNVVVVDNHSTDGTTAILAEQAKKHPTIKHIIPSRFDLSIGGCWNEAVASPECGRYAVQLDSDDLYSSPHTLQKMVDAFRGGDCAMVIGSYTLVNESLEEIPPGLIDHREWTDANGPNNALRINGLGAPRAFDTALIRRIGFLNVGYGEDYALALRLSREYGIGRIYESLYLCRRWTGNTDAALPVEKRNRNDSFKDKIRTIEIMARQRLNRETHLTERG
jgi:hypothetical protein